MWASCVPSHRTAGAAFGLPAIDKPAFAVIWTTTAWTIPANQALNLNPELVYALVDTPRGLLVLADSLVEKCLERYQLAGTVLARCPGKALGGLNFHHPLAHVDPGYDRLSPVYLADYATARRRYRPGALLAGLWRGRLQQLRGPWHDGAADPQPGAGQRPLRARSAPVRRHEHLEGLPGDHRHPAQCRPPVRDLGPAAQLPALLAPQDAGDLPGGCAVVHPHGRGRRRVHQGQVAQDPAPAGARRDRADRVLPGERPHAAARHDRRAPGLVHQPPAQLGRAAAVLHPPRFRRLHPRTMEILDQAADMVEAGGIEAWSKATPESIIGAEDAALYTKSNDILEVWFDSGTTHTTVLKGSHPGSGHDSGPEADLYLEGHDQHRGWFHSSLLTACAMYDRAPYKGLLTHGFTVDAQGRKMSKSQGNGVDPQETSKKLGAEIIRLWVAASDYSGDIAGDDKILARVVDTYRRVRNTLKFLLANTSDFDPATDAVAPGQMLEIDRYALSRAGGAAGRHPGALQGVRVPPGRGQAADLLQRGPGRVLPRHPEGPPVHLGAEVAGAPQRPDRPVADHPGDAALDGAVPELHRRGSLEGRGPIPSRSSWRPSRRCRPPDEALLAKWGRIREIRDIVNKEIEAVRAAGQVGSSLQATLSLGLPPQDLALLASLGEDLKFVFITSAASDCSP
jgi:isoleucyl-tRNA synthetase